MDEAYMEKLFDDVTALYHLDEHMETTGSQNGAKDLGPLPTTAKVLLTSLGVAWLLIIGWNVVYLSLIHI